MEQIAKEENCTPSQLVLAWLLAQCDDIIPIAGTKRRKYLEENGGALRVKLSPGFAPHREALQRGSIVTIKPNRVRIGALSIGGETE